MERRKVERHGTSIPVTVEGREERFKAEMDNLSISGCRVKSLHNWLVPGEIVSILFADGTEIKGLVAWTLETRLGIQFAEDLTPAVVVDLGFEVSSE